MAYVTMWAYPWDLVDEGIEEVVGTLKNQVGLDGISLATAYHTYEHLRPHLSCNNYLVTNTAMVYFQPQTDLYRNTILRPRVWPYAQEANPLKRIAEACHAVGLDLISWTVCLHNSYLGANYPRCTERTVFGDALPAMLCPSHPQVRAYMIALIADLSRNYGLHRIELESLSYGGYGHHHYHEKAGINFGALGRFLMNLCYCPSCLARAENQGIDGTALVEQARNLLEPLFATGNPLQQEVEEFIQTNSLFEAYVQMREEVVTSLVREIRKAMPAEVELSFLGMGGRYTNGAATETIAGIADYLEILAYTADTDALQRSIHNALLALKDPARLVVGLQAYYPASPDAETLLRITERALSLGIRQFSIYNYGIMPKANLDWVRQTVERIHQNDSF